MEVVAAFGQPAPAAPQTPRSVVLSLRPRVACASALSDATRDWALHALGPGPAAWAAVVGRDTTARLADMNAQDPLFPVAESNRACELALLTLLTRLAEGGDADPGDGDSLIPVIRDVVLRDIPIDRVVSALRFSQHLWTGLLIDQADMLHGSESLRRQLAQDIGSDFDHSVDRALRTYFAEMERFRGTPDAMRRSLIEGLLARRPVDQVVFRERLGVELSQWHVASILTVAGPTTAALRDLGPTTSAIGRALDAHSVLAHEVDGALWLWTSALRAPDVAAVADVVRDRRVTVGIGAPHLGESGFRRSHVEALDASRLAGAGRRGHVVAYRDVALVVTLSADLERAAWFVQDQLGAMATTSPRMAELRATVQAYLSSRQRPAVAAALLHIHRNTLLQRLARVEKLLGSRVDDRSAELHCALMLADEWGDLVLDSGRDLNRQPDTPAPGTLHRDRL